MKKIVVVFFLCIVFVTDAFTQTKSVTVYTAGSYVVDYSRKPCYWQGITRIDLPILEGTKQSGVNSIAIYSGTVYAAGYYSYSETDYFYSAVERYNAAFGDFKACYWQGTKIIDLPVPEGTKESVAHSIAISGGTVYVAGYYDEKACYWQGTTRIDLPVPVGTKGSMAHSIAISGGTVYTAGIYDGNACYWRGTKRIDLPVPVGTAGSANSIAISGGSVYTAGNYDRKACYWQGTKRIDLPVPDEKNLSILRGSATSITVNNDIVYVAVYYYYRVLDFLGYAACYWEGTTRKGLNIKYKDFRADYQYSSIAVANGTVYIAGIFPQEGHFFSDPPCYWQGTTRIDLPIPENGSHAQTASIVVSSE